MNEIARIINRIESIEAMHYEKRKLSVGDDLVEIDTVVRVYLAFGISFDHLHPLFVALRAKGFTRYPKSDQWEKWEKEDIQFRIIYG